MRIHLLLFLALCGSSDLLAIRPEGKMYGHQQLDMKKVEKELGIRFSIPFPNKRYDIDYFSRGDLLTANENSENVMVTCPFIVGPMISLAFGSGRDGADYKMTGDLAIEFSKDGKLQNVRVFSNGPGSDNPNIRERPVRKDTETPQQYYERAKKFWLKRLGEKKTLMSHAQLKVAFRVIEACFKQKPELELKAPMGFPPVEEVYRK